MAKSDKVEQSTLSVLDERVETLKRMFIVIINIIISRKRVDRIRNQREI